MIPLTFTDFPDNCVGLKDAPHAAILDALRSNGWPDLGTAENTLPSVSIKIWMLTVPEARTARAAAGYGGFGKLFA